MALLATGLAGCGGGGRVSLRADPQEALFDRPLEIHVHGARPNAAVSIRARSADAIGTAYRSSLAARADAHGDLDLRGNAAMRLLWSLAPASTGSPYVLIPAHLRERVTLAATIRGKEVRTTVVRDVVAADVHSHALRPSADGVYGSLFAPTHPRDVGVLVFGGSEGGLSTEGTAALLASHGYPSLALAYFAEPGLPPDLHDVPIEYFGRALHELRQRTSVKRIVVYGISRGSEAAQLVGIHYPRLVRGVVALVPSNGSVCGIPRYQEQPVSCVGAAWTWRGRPVPYDAPSPATSTPFPDERIAGPVLLDCGRLDELWPSCPMAHAIVHRLRVHHFTQTVTLLEYPLGGHAVGSLVPYVAGGGGPIGGAFPDANQAARAQGWPRLLRFLAGA